MSLAISVLVVLAGFQNRAAAIVITFQQGVDGYASTQDTQIRAQDPDKNYGAEVYALGDGNDGGTDQFPLPAQAVVRFNSIFGSGVRQIPFGSIINSAVLRLRSTFANSTSGDQFSVNRMLVDWNEDTATWNFFSSNGLPGIQTDLIEARGNSATFTPLFDAPFDTSIILTTSLAAWASGTANYGWLIRDVNGIDGYRFDTSEAVGGATAPPLLIVDFTAVPEPSMGSLCVVALAIISALRLRKRATSESQML